MMNWIGITTQMPDRSYTFTLTTNKLIDSVSYQETINGDGEPFRFGRVASGKLTFQFYLSAFDLTYINDTTVITWFNKQMDDPAILPVAQGRFFIKDIQIHNSVVSITAYSPVNLMDVSAYDFLKNATTTISPGVSNGVSITFFIQCLLTWASQAYKIDYGTPVFDDIPTALQQQVVYPTQIDLNTSQEVSVRQLLEYCAEIMNAFCVSRMNSQHTSETLVFKTLDFNSTDKLVDNSMYVYADFGFHIIPKVNGFVWGSANGQGYTLVYIKMPDGHDITYQIYNADTRQIITTESEYVKRQIYYLEANPLVNYNSHSASAINTIANTIMNSIDYHAGEVVLLKDYGWDIGDKIIVDGKPMFIMEKTISPSGIVFRSTGSTDRNFQEERKGYIVLTFREAQS